MIEDGDELRDIRLELAEASRRENDEKRQSVVECLRNHPVSREHNRESASAMTFLCMGVILIGTFEFHSLKADV